MANEYSVDDLLDFLSHAGERGLMPAATAQALAVAVRNVFGILSQEERGDVRRLDLDAVIKRFMNKRAKEFNPASLKEYGRRAHRAVNHFLVWRENPADFSVKTRTTTGGKKRDRAVRAEAAIDDDEMPERMPVRATGGYDSAFPVRPGRVVTISNVPEDLTTAEAERLAQFIKMLAVG